MKTRQEKREERKKNRSKMKVVGSSVKNISKIINKKTYEESDRKRI